MYREERKIIFLYDISKEEKKNIINIINIADKIIFNYFNKRCTKFSIIICEDEWTMTVQMAIHKRQQGKVGGDTNNISFTDLKLKEIVIRKDKATFGNYLHEMIYAIMYEGLTEQLREALAWYFTIELIKHHRYAIPSYPNWVIDLYLQPARHLVSMLGIDFVKDFALGNAEVADDLLPDDIQRLFLPEEFFYS
jgi:hypothetical protein